MTDTSDLLKRAQQLNEQAKHEENDTIRDRLIRMAEHYEHIAANEEWLAANPPSISSAMNLFNR